MLRFRRLYCSLIVTAVFCSGVYCGIRWNAGDARLPAVSSEPSPVFTESQFALLPVGIGADALPPVANAAAAPKTPHVPPDADAGTNIADTAPEAGSHSFATPGANFARMPHSPLPADNVPGTVVPAAPLPSFADTMPFVPPLSSFSLHKIGTGGEPTLLVVGGIQGDEPGGFSAAALMASHYKVRKGSVWVVPDLNFASILQRGRGLFGDMNRKFAAIDPKDPEYDTIMQIKSILLDDQVSLVLNLHDGSGFYRPTWENALRNPKRWGQSVIIDQEKIEAPRFNMLYETARKVEDEVNRVLIDPEHRYHIHNTLTAQGNTEMEKTLSYFAICNGKPAFGIEASKEFSTEYRAYYHLNIIESFMRQMGIEFERDFELTPGGVLAALNSNLKVAAYDNKWMLQLDNVRPAIATLPFKKGAEPDIRTSKPLLALVPDEGRPTWRVAYGNRTLTRVNPEFMDFDDSLDSLEILLDGKPHKVRMGNLVTVKDSFLVKSRPGFRVNAIGARKEKNGSEADITIVHKDFMPRFSLDKDATTYRVEVYKDKAFAGMVLVRFDKRDAIVNGAVPLTATEGPESALGF